MKLKTIFLITSLIAFVIGFSDAGESTFWHMGRPVGAILFMLFMIFNLLENESALHDEQNRQRHPSAGNNAQADRDAKYSFQPTSLSNNR